MNNSRRVYLDCAATTPADPRVIDHLVPYLDKVYGNASSLHQEGILARKVVEWSREQAALLIGAQAEEIYFTSGGTESDNFALKGLSRQTKKKHLITSSIEHPAVLQTARSLQLQGYDVTFLPVDCKGRVNPDDIKKAIRPETFLVSVMMGNNEIGSLQPLSEISEITRSAGVYLHSDAVQAVGNMSVNVKDLGVDLLSISSHKFYGPKGVGALYIRKGVPIQPLMDGGEHEKGKRSGTYNTPGIAGFGKACEIARLEMEVFLPKVIALRDYLIKELPQQIPELYLNGDPELRLPGNVHFSVPYVEGEALLLRLDDAGFAVSTGSACSSHNLKISHVLKAIGIDAVCAQGSLRISIGRNNTMEEMHALLEALPKVIIQLRQMSPLYKPASKGV